MTCSPSEVWLWGASYPSVLVTVVGEVLGIYGSSSCLPGEGRRRSRREHSVSGRLQGDRRTPATVASSYGSVAM